MIVGIALLPMLGYAQESAKRNLSLDEAISLSLQNNKTLQLNAAKVAEAVANQHEAWERHLPDFKVSGSYLRVNNPDVDFKLKLGSSGSSSGGSSSGGSTPKVESAAYGMASASLPLFSGLRIKYGVESAKYLTEAAKMDAAYDKEDVVQNTIAAYANLFKAQQTVYLIQENLKQQQQRVKDFSNLEQNGVLAMNDLLKAQLQQSNIELSLLDAQNNYNITCVNMSLMLGLDEHTQFVADSNAFKPTVSTTTVTEWEQQAAQNRSDLKSIGLKEKAVATSVKAAKGEYYPGVALTGGYIALDVPNVLTVTNALNAGIGLQYNLSSLWKTKSKIDAAKARLQQMEISEKMLNDRIHIQINQAYEGYLLALKKIDVYVKAVNQATENYRITKNKYDNNLVTTTDLLDADVALLQAKLNYSFSKADAATAYAKLQQAAGVLN